MGDFKVATPAEQQQNGNGQGFLGGLLKAWKAKMVDDKGFFQGQYEGTDEDILKFSRGQELRNIGDTYPARDSQARGYGYRGDTYVSTDVSRNLVKPGEFNYRRQADDVSGSGLERNIEQKSTFHGIIGKLNDLRMEQELQLLADEYNKAKSGVDMGQSWRQAGAYDTGFGISGIDSGDDYNQRYQGDMQGMPQDLNTPDMRVINRMDRRYLGEAQGAIHKRSSQPNNIMEALIGMFQ